MRYKINPQNIVAVDVYLEKRKTRVYVGKLTCENLEYRFVYDKNYLQAKTAIPLGNELLLTQREYISKTLFSFFSDRIPSRENPSYPDYCISAGISETEENSLVLLSTIGRKGPSSFIFEPKYAMGFDGKICKSFREKLGLTTREFASVFSVAKATVNAIEGGKHSCKEVLKRLEIYYRYPSVALYEIFIFGGALHDRKKNQIINILERQQKDLGNNWGQAAPLYKERTKGTD